MSEGLDGQEKLITAIIENPLAGYTYARLMMIVNLYTRIFAVDYKMRFGGNPEEEPTEGVITRLENKGVIEIDDDAVVTLTAKGKECSRTTAEEVGKDAMVNVRKTVTAVAVFSDGEVREWLTSLVREWANED